MTKGQSGPEASHSFSLGSSRFLKTIKCKHEQGPLILKIFTKHDPSVDLSSYIHQLKTQQDAFQKYTLPFIHARIPNLLAFDIIHETEKAGYLSRSCISMNLYDRISTRPFLLNSEKKWIAYQLLFAISQAHELNVPKSSIHSISRFVMAISRQRMCLFPLGIGFSCRILV